MIILTEMYFFKLIMYYKNKGFAIYKYRKSTLSEKKI